MFPTKHQWGPQYGSPSPVSQTHLLCSSESAVCPFRRTGRFQGEMEKVHVPKCGSVHGLALCSLQLIFNYMNVDFCRCSACWLPRPATPAIPEHDWTPLNHKRDTYKYCIQPGRSWGPSFSCFRLLTVSNLLDFLHSAWSLLAPGTRVVQGPVSLQCCTTVWRHNTSWWCIGSRWQNYIPRNVGKTMP